MARWTPDQRREALELYVELGPSAASEATGIPKGTIGWWAHREGVRTVGAERTAAATEAAALRWAERRANLADEAGAAAALALEQTVHALQGRTDEDTLVLAGARDAKDLALTFAVLVDKAQLLTGEATSRHAMQAEQREGVLDGARRDALRLVTG